METWKDIEGFPCYQVSNLGRVRSNKKLASKTIIMKPIFVKSYRNTGYYKVGLCRGTFGNSEKIPFFIHRIVATAFIPNPEGKPHVNHKDNNKANNAVTNLEWVTVAENNQHAYREGFKVAPRGEQRYWNTKLKEAQVIEIKARSAKGEPVNSIYRDYPVAYATVKDIVENRTWKHLNQAA